MRAHRAVLFAMIATLPSKVNRSVAALTDTAENLIQNMRRMKAAMQCLASKKSIRLERAG